MLFGFGILATAILLSSVAAYYSVAGLTAIFSAATIPVIIMGGSLELGKIVATVWLHNNWKRAGFIFKAYLVPAVAFLMLLTSMGIFGYLSKAHSDQSLVSGDSMSKVAIFDEKIKISKDNIDANRKALKQMDEAVDQVMGRSSDEKGADKAVAVRRSQQKERGRLQSEIQTEQKTITALSEEAAPLRAEFRKIEAEVGPIKYIAALVYGDNPDANVLEKAVRLVIIMIVLVFDPLALTLILAATKQFEWARHGKGGWDHDDPEPKPAEVVAPEPPLAYEPDDGPLTTAQIDQIQADANEHLPTGNVVAKTQLFDEIDPPAKTEVANTNDDYIWTGLAETPVETEVTTHNDEDSPEKIAERAWKAENPTGTLKRQRQLYEAGMIKQLPWLDPDFLSKALGELKVQPDNRPPKLRTTTGFGTSFPEHPNKGDTHLRVDNFPTVLYKYNGHSWIEVDKALNNDAYVYDDAYIDHLINKIGSGEYDLDLLSESEKERIAARLQEPPKA
jgi:hypothetical protein